MQSFYVFNVIYLNCTKHCHEWKLANFYKQCNIWAESNVLQSKPLASVLKTEEIKSHVSLKTILIIFYLNIRKFGNFEEMKCGVIYHETH